MPTVRLSRRQHQPSAPAGLPSTTSAWTTRQTLKPSTRDNTDGGWRRSRRAWELAALVPCAIIFCSMAFLRWQDYASSPVFTSYEAHYLQEVVFPGVTFCMWPPFNPKRLASAGVGYNFSHHCNRVYNGIFYKLKCDWGQVYEELLWELPGAWKRDLDLVWREAAWRPSDLFISYKYAGQTYAVTDEEDGQGRFSASPLQPTLSALNRCFTFTPPTRLVRPHTHLDVQLKRLRAEYVGKQKCNDAKYYWPVEDRYKPEDVHQFWKCYQQYFMMYVLVHPPGRHPLLLDGITATQLVPTAIRVKSRIHVSLDMYDRLRSTRVPCVMEEEQGHEDYTGQEDCLQRCVVQAAITQHHCRLPYTPWTPANPCTRDQYLQFPRYTQSVGRSLGNYSEVMAECLASCPETCRVLHYTTTDTTDADSNIEVAFDRPMYNHIVESWSYTGVQLVSNVGGLASFFLGVSLYQILTCCLSQHQQEEEDPH